MKHRWIQRQLVGLLAIVSDPTNVSPIIVLCPWRRRSESLWPHGTQFFGLVQKLVDPASIEASVEVAHRAVSHKQGLEECSWRKLPEREVA